MTTFFHSHYLRSPSGLFTVAMLLASAGTARAQAPSFGPVASYSAGANSAPHTVARGDVNGDGRLDIVSANPFSNTVGVLLGQASGTFAPVTTYPTGTNSYPYAVVLGDVNGDGRPDILATSNNPSKIGVLLGQANGTFASVVDYAAGGRVDDIALADVSGDGRPDVVGTNNDTHTVGVLLGRAGGTFAPVVLYSTGAATYPASVALGDVNGDGRPDIVTANSYTDTAGVLLGQAGGTFAAVVQYAVGAPGSRPISVALGDVNGDGRPDIVTANSFNDTAGVLLGQAGGTFATAVAYSTGTNSDPESVALGDVNGDGRPDIVTANALSSTAGVLQGRAGGTFAAVVAYSTGASSAPTSVVLGDVNGDGRPDLVTANEGTNAVGILLNTGTYAPLAAAAALTATQVQLYPNPARARFAVLLPGVAGATAVQAELLNALGQVVRRQAAALPASGTTLTVETSELAAGVYTLRLRAGATTVTQRVVLQ